VLRALFESASLGFFRYQQNEGTNASQAVNKNGVETAAQAEYLPAKQVRWRILAAAVAARPFSSKHVNA
jgi:hypothetical protein